MRSSSRVTILRRILVTVLLATVGVVPAQPAAADERADEDRARDQMALRGRVRDKATGAPVAGAIVATGSLETTTGDDGWFELAGVSAGWIDLVVVADGYEPLVERARPGVPLRLLVVATGELGGSELITIEEKRKLDGQATSYDVGREVIRTLPGSGNDALKSLQNLPGTSRVPFGLGGLVLRGFAPRDTNIFLDGIEVPILYHFGGLASFFPSTMIESMELVSSGYGARYGRGQGGLVELRSRPGRTDRWAVGSEVSLLDASVRTSTASCAGSPARAS
ncbi:MAG: TonB-dependent receptor plug domain-containing protein [Proteobacteria bacterium]|nr:TonB-dependent receptor plug domain-containing protein [Pseudomonadota bacterium]